MGLRREHRLANVATRGGPECAVDVPNLADYLSKVEGGAGLRAHHNTSGYV